MLCCVHLFNQLVEMYIEIIPNLVKHAEDHFIWHLIYWPLQSYVFLISCLSQNSAPLVKIFLSLFQNVCNVLFDCAVTSLQQSLG